MLAKNWGWLVEEVLRAATGRPQENLGELGVEEELQCTQQAAQ